MQSPSGQPSAPVFLYLWVKWQKRRARRQLAVLAFVIGGRCNPANVRLCGAINRLSGKWRRLCLSEKCRKPTAGCLSGWASFWANDAPSLSIMALAIVSNLGFLTPIDPLLGKFIAAGLIIAFMLLHLRYSVPKAAQHFRR
ncbi:hypothetical protein ACLB1N_27370 [Escherichia coli]